MRKLSKDPLEELLESGFSLEDDDIGDEEEENTERLDEGADKPLGAVYEVLFHIDYDTGAEKHKSWEEEKEAKQFAKELFEDMFGVEIKKPADEYFVPDETAFTFTVPKDQIKELIAKIHQFTDMEGGDFIPLIDDLVAFDFNVVDPLGSDDAFPRSEPFEDEIRFSQWEERL